MNPKTQKKLDTYKLKVYISQLIKEPGDFMFAESTNIDFEEVGYPLSVFERVLFQIISIDSNGLLRLRFIHYQGLKEHVPERRRIPDEYKTMKAGTDIAVSMTRCGSYYLRKNRCFYLSHVSLEKMKLTSLLSHIPKHPLLDPKLFDKFITLSAIDYIRKIDMTSNYFRCVNKT